MAAKKFTRQKQKRVLAFLEHTLNVSQAMAEVGLPRTYFYRQIDKDQRFENEYNYLLVTLKTGAKSQLMEYVHNGIENEITESVVVFEKDKDGITTKVPKQQTVKVVKDRTAHSRLLMELLGRIDDGYARRRPREFPMAPPREDQDAIESQAETINTDMLTDDELIELERITRKISENQ